MEDEDDHPAWDDAAAQALVGCYILIGLTYVTSLGETDRLEQLHGWITEADEHEGFAVDLAGSRTGDVYWLPPHLAAFIPAASGSYRLRATGEVIVDPDFITEWTVTPPAG